MKLKSLVLALMLAAGGLAHADNINGNVNLGGTAAGPLSAGFGVTHLEMGEFTDTFTFSPSDGFFTVDASLITIGFMPSTDVDFYSADINGVALTLTPEGNVEYGTLSMSPITGPLVLTVRGMVGDSMSGDASASYAGTLNISAVPEPETWGMMLGGLGILGFLSRRRRSTLG